MTVNKNQNGITSFLESLDEKSVFWNLPTGLLVEHSLSNKECVLSNTGAVIVETGLHTGRSPNDKYIVDNGTEINGDIAWGSVNKPFLPEHFDQIYSRILEYLKARKLYVQDLSAGKHESYSKNFRIITERAWAALFTQDLLIPVAANQLTETDYTIIHVPGFHAKPVIDGTRSETFIILDFLKRIILIGGTSYAGEIKKSVFTIMNYSLPSKNVLPMHCSANIGISHDTALFFGLSGTGKTTLSSSQNRDLIGDDEHGWAEDGVFNFEGGCYAKTINLKQELEPLIWNACQRFGAVLENVGFHEKSRELDFNDDSKTENTRAAYPIEYIDGHVASGKGGHPKNIFFLCADAFGVIPPISLLTDEQAIYYFLLGYTSKLAGTEEGLGKEPEATFSACFGEPFLPLSTAVYADLLLKKIKLHCPKVWLINTGWTGGPYGIGERIKLPYSRTMINSVISGIINEKSFHKEEMFGLNIPHQIDGIPMNLLDPVKTWSDSDHYYQVARQLIGKMQMQMKKFIGEIDPKITQSGPIDMSKVTNY